MAMFDSADSDPNKVVRWGNYSDVCLLCLREKIQEEKKDVVRVRKELSGKLLNKKVVKIRHGGTDIVLCEDHIKESYDEIAQANHDVGTQLAALVEEESGDSDKKDNPSAVKEGTKRGRAHGKTEE